MVSRPRFSQHASFGPPCNPHEIAKSRDVFPIHPLSVYTPGLHPACIPIMLSQAGVPLLRIHPANTRCFVVASFRRACPKFLRQTFHEFASHSLAKSTWARAFYDLQRSKGKGHHAATRSLAFQWIRILYRCWKDRTPYDEATYLQSLQKRRSPLDGLLGPGTKIGWKPTGGFQSSPWKKGRILPEFYLNSTGGR